MAKIVLKTQKPLIEKRVQAKDSKDFINVGIKSYSDSELNELRKTFGDPADGIKLQRWIKELENLKDRDDLTDEDIENEVSRLQANIDSVIESQKIDSVKFINENVLYIKNASLLLQDGEFTKDLTITDTRDVKPVASLWESPEECLAALLELYLDNASFKDALIKVVTQTVFGTSDSERQEARTKNS